MKTFRIIDEIEELELSWSFEDCFKFFAGARRGMATLFAIHKLEINETLHLSDNDAHVKLARSGTMHITRVS